MKSLTTALTSTPPTQNLVQSSSLSGEGELVKKIKDQEHPPWIMFAFFLLTAVVTLALYGWSVHSATVIVAELLVAAAAISVGALLGFLFGIPRGPAQADNSDKTVTSPNYRPSNSLEQVAEWLTKILVGAGLVQLGKLGNALSTFGNTLAFSLKNPPPGTEVVTELVAVAFVLFGFLISFLWTRISYSRLQTLTDRGIQDALNEALKEASTAIMVASNLNSGVITTPGTPTKPEEEVKTIEHPMDTQAWPEEVRRKVEEFKNSPSNWDDDTAGRLFRGRPEQAEGKVLEADFVLELLGAVVITLRVRSTTGKPLAGTVTFLLHPSFIKSVLEVQPIGGRAETQITAGQWFTVVAILDEGKTVLSYDLRKMPNAPPWFKAS